MEPQAGQPCRPARIHAAHTMPFSRRRGASPATISAPSLDILVKEQTLGRTLLVENPPYGTWIAAFAGMTSPPPPSAATKSISRRATETQGMTDFKCISPTLRPCVSACHHAFVRDTCPARRLLWSSIRRFRLCHSCESRNPSSENRQPATENCSSSADFADARRFSTENREPTTSNRLPPTTDYRLPKTFFFPCPSRPPPA